MKHVKWILDPVHSEVQFKVKHLMISTVTGKFQSFQLEAETAGDDFKSINNLLFTADVNSISTDNEQRDTHLKSADFFDADNFEEIRFTASEYQQIQQDFYQLSGVLMIKNTSRSLSVNVEFGGIVIDSYGQTKAGFTVSCQISRQDFGLTWNAVTEAGSVVVSDEVRISGEVQLIKQAQ
jgi:polyisoprenoid-binding protein YceI